MTEQVVDMVNFDVDETLEEITRQRFSMPPEVIAAFRQAGGKMAERLYSMVMQDDKFDKLSFSQKMKLAEVVFDRAFGKSETASASAMTLHRTGEGGTGKHGEQVKQITQRMKERDEQLPEMTNSARAARRAAVPQSPEAARERRKRALRVVQGSDQELDDVPMGELVAIREVS